MLDIKLFANDLEGVKKSLASRNPALLTLVGEITELNKTYKELLTSVENMRAKRNELSKSVGILKQKDPAAAEEAMKEVSLIKTGMSEKENMLEEIKKKISNTMLNIPNMPDPSVTIGKDEKDNKEIRKDGAAPSFSFKPLDHHAVGEKLGILDFETAAVLSGSRFALLKGDGARLERALISYMLDKHAKKGYTEVVPPSIVNEEILIGTGQLPKFREDMYALEGEPKQFLISTAEIPLTNMNRGKVLQEAELPVKLTAGTPCFRKEAGTYGKDTRGLIRNHQFDKVELVMISNSNDSFNLLEAMTADAEDVLKGLGLAYRTVELCTGDMGFSSAKTYDIEVWMPSENKYREISSCSNCTSFQARRMNLRYKNAEGKIEFVHTLNGSGVAVGRALAAILENYQQEDGSVIVPEALRPYFGKDIIK
ncbi:Seryl-tRNA synthetase [Elusimicrobium minutum Pei191]|uniref:Serine--tRNA ligase n=1 Tax=Elusimicrobium minutum (strain Pei191) TaxID=445932 RepID=SYS_ELUMP|nr:serine--tRNA ligase [Elusimicrobium minutum]B2KEV5.1 RecName: Full=Serine--tRNA ligase; AltName: Full=Seryl-tRNA synthetase; Short=SerRS; AltName: Full=Seryl-tRNA(Ser/Sec) synthetase [Elusimicrobium minutum Pei191]ACC99051.1 Seryl-tRNA synthetase [Elusimicrobium minutum Pei191]